MILCSCPGMLSYYLLVSLARAILYICWKNKSLYITSTGIVLNCVELLSSKEDYVQIQGQREIESSILAFQHF